MTVHYFGGEGDAGAWKRYRSGAPASEARARIDATLKRLNPGAVFGSLGSPSEIVFAEAALAAGKELNVILSLPAPVFAAIVLKSAGKDWRARFEACRAAANRLDTIAEEPDSDDPGLGEHAGRVAMGLALQRAQNLDGEARQVILADCADDALDSPLAAAWSKDKRRRHTIVDLGGGAAKRIRPKAVPPRQCSALVFGDLPGFSRMPEKYLPIFWNTVMRAIGDVLTERGEAVALKNTWGDAIHLVVPDIKTAAEICLAVQARLSTIDGSVMGRAEAPDHARRRALWAGLLRLGSDRRQRHVLRPLIVAGGAHRADHAAWRSLCDGGLRSSPAARDPRRVHLQLCGNGSAREGLWHVSDVRPPRRG